MHGPGTGVVRRRAAAAVLAAVALVWVTVPVRAGSRHRDFPRAERPASVPGDEALEAEGATIGSILIRTGDIFDTSIPEEDRWLFRTANRLHWKTREDVVRRMLLFAEGDRYEARLLAESERLLRDTKYLYDAQIRPVRYHDGRVDVEVVTRDVWTLQVGFGFSRSGGENRTRIGVQDSNFLGMGKDLTVRRTSDVDRTEVMYRYWDRQLFGSRARLRLQYSDNSDGVLHLLALGRPFYSLDTRWAVEGSAGSFDRVESLYARGEISESFRQRTDHFQVRAGFSRGIVDGVVRRWSAGFTWEEERFGEEPGEGPAGVPPPDRTLSYPWFSFESISERFVELRNLDRIQRTEDLNFGHEIDVRIGWSSKSFGADRNRAVLRAGARVGYTPRPGRLWLFGAHASGRFGGGDGGENVLAGGRIRYFARNLGVHKFYVSLSADAASRLDGERQLLLGGDSGLRGYPLRYVDGDRRFLLTLEQRFYTSWYPFRLVHVGGAVFLDIGRAWWSGGRGGDDPGVLKDVGFGLRIGSSRSSRASMVHVDVAFPLDRDDDIRYVQLLVTTQETF